MQEEKDVKKLSHLEQGQGGKDGECQELICDKPCLLRQNGAVKRNWVRLTMLYESKIGCTGQN